MGKKLRVMHTVGRKIMRAYHKEFGSAGKEVGGESWMVEEGDMCVEVEERKK